ncbi:hypothetical protein HIM_07815 [Hirsutella minnesotensis 3608]|uniref:Uncharacterized protein n=1 Tax=Hirsutella minnesotensis 3608 TaxID=1043627 RepID=A0A0F7ZHL9_9HYPO|nr:hypothetical protein HIM_07815 [Hirsutella minnesotensis 3608]
MAGHSPPEKRHLSRNSRMPDLRPPPRAPSPPPPATDLDQERRAHRVIMATPNNTGLLPGHLMNPQHQRAVIHSTMQAQHNTALQTIPAHMPADRHLFDPQRRYGVQISDIRNECMTEADARHALSSFVIFRMQKLQCPNEVDEEGYPLRPTWQRISLVEETTLSQQEATRKVNALLKETGPVGDKKSALGPAVQRQIEKVQQELQQKDPDPRYQYILAQLESQLKRIEKSSPLVMVKRSKKSKRGKAIKTLSMQPKKSAKHERVAVTVYFKRTPKPGECATTMLIEREIRRKTPMLPAPERQSIQQSQLPPQPRAQQPAPIQPPTAHPPIRPIQNEYPDGQRHFDTKATRGSSRSSRSSPSSGFSSDSESSRTTSTDSASDARRPQYRRASHSREQSQHRYSTRPEGLDIVRRHPKKDQDTASTSSAARSLPHGKRWTPPSTLDNDERRDYPNLDGGRKGKKVGFLESRPPTTRPLPYAHVSDDQGRRNLLDDKLERWNKQLHRNQLMDAHLGPDFRRKLDEQCVSPRGSYERREPARHGADESRNPFDMFKGRSASYTAPYRR